MFGTAVRARGLRQDLVHVPRIDRRISEVVQRAAVVFRDPYRAGDGRQQVRVGALAAEIDVLARRQRAAPEPASTHGMFR